jgi:small subunit ribosomal protein S6
VRSRDYETVYILKSGVDADTVDKVQGRVTEVIDREQGKLVKVEAWGRRKLAYPVAKEKRGVYVYVKYLGRGGLVAELERNLKLNDAVIKYQTVLLSESVDAATVAVDPDAVKWERLDLPADDAHDDSLERSLGLLDPEPSHRRRREEEEYVDEDFDEAAVSKAAPPAAAPEEN